LKWRVGHPPAREAESQATEFEDRLEISEAYFCQSELLDFIGSGRYRPVPLNFANAMAGLPYMRWRQSFKRCQRISRSITETICYEQFKLIRHAINGLPISCEQFETNLRSILMNPDRQGGHNYAIHELKKNWYYVTRAIEAAIRFASTVDALPYRIIAAYSFYTMSKSAVDVLLEEEYRLT
jgi:hypothetical protein